jgi:hypothetical protein
MSFPAALFRWKITIPCGPDLTEKQQQTLDFVAKDIFDYIDNIWIIKGMTESIHKKFDIREMMILYEFLSSDLKTGNIFDTLACPIIDSFMKLSTQN